MKKFKKGVKWFVRILKFAFYVLTFLLPAIATPLLGVANTIIDYIINYPVYAIIIFIVPVILSRCLEPIANICSFIYMVFATLMLRNIVSFAELEVESGLSRSEAFIQIIPTLAVILFGLLFLYISTSDSYVFGMMVCRIRDNINHRKALKCVSEFRKAEKNQDELGMENAQTKFDNANAQWTKSLNTDRPTFLDSLVVSLIFGAIFAAIFTIISYFIFVYSNMNLILESIGTYLICNLAFLLIDLFYIFYGLTYDEVEDSTGRTIT